MFTVLKHVPNHTGQVLRLGLYYWKAWAKLIHIRTLFTNKHEQVCQRN